jgi:hypothetical protein
MSLPLNMEVVKDQLIRISNGNKKNFYKKNIYIQNLFNIKYPTLRLFLFLNQIEK